MDNEIMIRTCEIAKENVEKYNGGPFGCIITDSDGKIIVEGRNMVSETNDPTQHAEMVAIRRAAYILDDYNLNGCTLYSSCEPCPMCLGAIYWARIDRVYYSNTRNDAKRIGFDDEWIYTEFSKSPQERQIQMTQLIVENTPEAFNEWEKNEDRISY
jgi:tRNA(Arg) A34 adenosine deaminase TadA